MIGAADALRSEDSDTDIRMLLSGGRKGMTALSFLAAQRSHIARVYHTLVTDPELEKRIERECSADALNRLGSPGKKADRMFLKEYSESDFELVDIPIITF